jgi:hypothetical protein
MASTSAQRTAAFNIVLSIAEAIRDLKSVPSGHLYARLMGQMTLEQYNSIIDILKSAGAVTEKGHLLTWTGPAAAPKEA